VPAALRAAPVAVKYREGTSHGFVTVRSTDGNLLATGDAIQTVKGNRVYSELVLHFRDGSLHEEHTEFSQDSVFHLISDHLMQHGPSFPQSADTYIEVARGLVRFRGKDGKDEESHLRLPDDVANGLLITIVKNLTQSQGETTVSLVAIAPKPRVVKFKFRPGGTGRFSADGPPREALHFVGHTEITGLAGGIAAIMGKQPPDVDFWIADGKAPAFLRYLGALYDGGPVWNIELAAPRLEQEASDRRESQPDQKPPPPD
jgi:hypothetical protein